MVDYYFYLYGLQFFYIDTYNIYRKCLLNETDYIFVLKKPP